MPGPQPPGDTLSDRPYDAALAAALDHWPGQAGVAVVGPDGVLAQAGSTASHPWASVTKLLTALGVLDLAWSGELSLDDPAGPAGATLRHLLAHASGLAMDQDRVLAPPGTRRIYSNRGIEVAAAYAADATGRRFEEIVGEAVLEPLELDGVRLTGSPAHGASGTVADLARLAHALLAAPAGDSLLDARLVEQARTTAFPGLVGVLPGFGRQDPNDWGLGFEVRAHKRPHWTAPDGSPATYGHFGQAGSFLWVDPVARIACVACGSEPFGPWAAELWPRLAAAVLAARP